MTVRVRQAVFVLACALFLPVAAYAQASSSA